MHDVEGEVLVRINAFPHRRCRDLIMCHHCDLIAQLLLRLRATQLQVKSSPSRCCPHNPSAAIGRSDSGMLVRIRANWFLGDLTGVFAENVVLLSVLYERHKIVCCLPRRCNTLSFTCGTCVPFPLRFLLGFTKSEVDVSTAPGRYSERSLPSRTLPPAQSLGEKLCCRMLSYSARGQCGRYNR